MTWGANVLPISISSTFTGSSSNSRWKFIPKPYSSIIPENEPARKLSLSPGQFLLRLNGYVTMGESA